MISSALNIPASKRPTLIVVDYAAQRHAELTHWLWLYPERHADTDNGWFANCKDWPCAAAKGLTPEPIPYLFLTTVPKVMLPADQRTGPKLMELSWGGDPLFLAMAAPTMAKTAAASTDRAAPTWIASEEHQRLSKLAKSRKWMSLLCQHGQSWRKVRCVIQQYADRRSLHAPAADAGALAGCQHEIFSAVNSAHLICNGWSGWHKKALLLGD